mmetsp:Transcript_17097/g.15056  ORF Transcript_17097/g.15056 Transcript_17097/m.15056 type:complete len:176 (-) Transcript_17097:261-788(-)
MIREEILERSFTEEEKNTDDYRDKIKIKKLRHGTDYQILPGDTPARIFFRLYRLFYVLAGISACYLMKNDTKIARQYKKILIDLQTNPPIVKEILMESNDKYLFRMEKGHMATKEDFLKIETETIDDPLCIINIYACISFPIIAFLAHFFHMYKFRDFIKQKQLKIFWMLVFGPA